MRRWEILASLINEDKLFSMAEVGCKEGRTTAYVLRHCPDLTRMVAIDPWIAQPDQKDKLGGETYEDWNFETIEKMFNENVNNDPRCKMIRATSLEAATIEKLESSCTFDLVFIDAAHDYDSVMQDIKTWRNWTKPGGYIVGHDYQHKFPSVMRAVADSFNLMQVQLADDSVWWTKNL